MGPEVSGRMSINGVDGGLAAAITPAVLIQDFPAMNDGDAIETTKVVEADPRCAVPHDTLKQTFPWCASRLGPQVVKNNSLHNARFVHKFL